MKKVLRLLLTTCTGNYLYSATFVLPVTSNSGAFVDELRPQPLAAASPYDLFMANWQANPNFEEADEYYSFGSGHTRIGFKTRSNQASAMAEQDTPTM